MKGLLRSFVGAMVVILVVAGCAAPAAPVAAVPPTVAPATPTSAPPAPAPAAADPLDIAQAYADAMANGDADAALALFADDAKLVDETGTDLATGRDAIRNFLEYNMAQEYREYDTECAATANPDIIECHALWKVVIIPDGEGRSTYDITVKEGKITLLNTTDDHWDAAAEANSGAFFAWFSATHPDDLKRIFDSLGKNEYSRELGEQIADAYHEWEATKLTPTPAPATADPLDVVQAYRDALAKRDVDAMLAVFTENAFLQHVDGVSHTGKAELRGFFDYMIVLEFTEPAVECKAGVAPDLAECKGKFDAIAFGGYEAGYTVQIKEGKIDKFYWAMYSWPDQPRFLRLRAWSLAAHPEELALYDKKVSSFAYDRELGEILKWLYDEWQASLTAPAPVTADPLKVVQAYRDALAKHDVVKMMALFNENAEWRHTEGETVLTFNGLDELRNFLGYYAVALDYKELRGACSLTPDKARVHCKVQARNVPYGSFVVTYDAAIAGDKISAIDLTEDLDAAAQARREEFVDWAKTAHPEEMARIDAEFDKNAFNQDLGEALAALHAEWQAAKPTPVPVAAAVPDVVQKFRDALADRDTAAVVALFTDTGEWRHNGTITFKGRAELEPWLGYLWGLRYRELEATCEGTVQASLTKCEARVFSALFNEYAATYHVEVTEGKINAILWQDKVGTEANARFDAFLKWLADTHPEENARIWEGLGNKSGYNQALGESIANVHDEWQASQK